MKRLVDLGRDICFESMIIKAILVDTGQHGRHAARPAGLLAACSLGAKLCERTKRHNFFNCQNAWMMMGQDKIQSF